MERITTLVCAAILLSGFAAGPVAQSAAYLPVSGTTSLSSPAGAWSEDFESYSPESFPSPDWSASGSLSTAIDAAIYYSGHQSVRMYGWEGACWAALIHRLIDSADAYTFEFRVRNGIEPVTGCHQIRGCLQIHTEPNWTSGVRLLVSFRPDSVIRGTMPNADTAEGIRLGTYLPLDWIKVRVNYRILNADSIQISYWIDDVFARTERLAALPYEHQFRYISPSAAEGTCWFDNVSVSPACCTGTTGNVNVVNIIDVSDLSLLVTYLTVNPPPVLPCLDAANVNAKGIIDLSDLSLLVAYLTTNPPPPLPVCP